LKSKYPVIYNNKRKGFYFMNKFKELVELKPQDSIYEKQEGVKYAEFKKYTYYSRTAERDTNMNVLLPVDYTEEKKYPVLYILHGFWDSEDWMARPEVSLNVMLANLQAQGLAKEMIIVLPYIFCNKELDHCTGMDLVNANSYDNFINDLLLDVKPFVEKTFSVAEGRENAAVTGFSMGGKEALFISFAHPELFGYVGAACPAPGLVEIPGSALHPGQIQPEELAYPEDLKPAVVVVTSSLADGVVGPAPKSYLDMMTNNGTEYIWHLLEDTWHDHTSVKPHLYNYLRMIFQ